MDSENRVACCPDVPVPHRRGVQLIDCTIRDGGLCNGWSFDLALVQRTVAALCTAGIDVIEIGYRSARELADSHLAGPWRHSSDEDIRGVLGAPVDHSGHSGHTKIAVMLDQGHAHLSDLRPKAESPVDIVRVATYAKDVAAAIELLHGAEELGYEVHCNVMAVSRLQPREIDAFLEQLAQSRIPNVTVVDSFGALHPQHVRRLVRVYRDALRPDQKVGVHMHNNQQTAFANTLAAIEEGADFVDATIYGMGRGSGNCPLELLLLALRDEDPPDLGPLLDVVDDYARLCAELRWGYQIPYAVSGALNVHPRVAIAEVRSTRAASREFYERLVGEHAPARRRSRG